MATEDRFIIVFSEAWAYNSYTTQAGDLTTIRAEAILVATEGRYSLVAAHQNIDVDAEFGTLVDFLGYMDGNTAMERARKRLGLDGSAEPGWVSIPTDNGGALDLSAVAESRTSAEISAERGVIKVISQFGQLRLVTKKELAH